MDTVLIDVGRAFIRYGRAEKSSHVVNQGKLPNRDQGYAAAIGEAIAALGLDPSRARLALAYPGPYVGTLYVPQGMSVRWHMDASTLSKDLGLAGAMIMHDMTAAALAISRLDDVAPIAIHEPSRRGAGMAAIVQTGVGLGLATLFGDEQGVDLRTGEGGSVTLGLPATATVDEIAVAEALRTAEADDFKLGRGTAQFALSLTSLPRVFASLGGEPRAPETLKAGDVGPGSPYRRAIEVYVRLLGTYASNVALTFRASQGVYIAGGASQLLKPDHFAFARDALRSRFLLHEGKFAADSAEAGIAQTLRSTPLYLVTDEYASLKGLATYSARFNG